ncbi:MAG: hypothetical protein QY323_00205 [Patescibacteria group bacterium]|nr:MAG: hypothetical protein QY323_00205 [Patescibacteria group bacterium]
MSLDDFFFYLPAYGSIALALAGAAASWLAWRLLAAWHRKRRAAKSVENSPKT